MSITEHACTLTDSICDEFLLYLKKIVLKSVCCYVGLPKVSWQDPPYEKLSTNLGCTVKKMYNTLYQIWLDFSCAYLYFYSLYGFPIPTTLPLCVTPQPSKKVAFGFLGNPKSRERRETKWGGVVKNPPSVQERRRGEYKYNSEEDEWEHMWCQPRPVPS